MHHHHLDYAIAKISNAPTIEDLAEAVRAGLDVLSFDDVAGSIPDAFFDAHAMPDDLVGLIAFTPSHELRLDFETGEIELRARGATSHRAAG